MNNADWDTPRNPWDDGTYQTGSTRPPKKHSGVVAVLLAALILLGGMVSALGILNIRLLRQTRTEAGTGEGSVSFRDIDPSDPPLATVDTAQTSGATAVPDEGDGIPVASSPPSAENIPQSGGLSLQAIYEKAIPSVVSIACTTASGTSSGTGVVLTAGGYLVTNAHVVDGAQNITVQCSDDAVYEAALIGADGVSDLAVLHVDAEALVPAEFGDDSALRVGDAVVAIGDPLGVALRGTMTDGIVSAINRNITTGGRTMTLIQTNAALNAGNSGGPLLNCYGQVIGINTMKIGDYVDSAGVEGLGFAIPSSTVKEIVDQLIAQGYVSGRPGLGVTGESVSVFYQMLYRLPEGFQITAVSEGSEAEQKGLQSGDIILQADGTRVTGADDLNTVLYAHEVGDTIQIVIFRNNRQYSLELTLVEAGKDG